MSVPEDSRSAASAEQRAATAETAATPRSSSPFAQRVPPKLRGGAIRFTCPHCGTESRVSREFLGQSGPCTACGAHVTISTETGAEIESSSADAQVLGVLVAVSVLAILVIVVAGVVYLPRVSWTTPEGLRKRSVSQLQQLGVAMQSHVSNQNALPANSERPTNVPGDQRVSWIAPLLPYLDEYNLSMQVDVELSATANSNRIAGSTPLPIFQTPGNPPQQPQSVNFVGIAGLGSNAAKLPLSDKRAGAFGYDRRVTMADVTDGLSNTMFLAETHHNLGPWIQGGPSTIRGVDINDRPYIGDYRQFGSNRGCLILLGDGSVRDLNPAIAPEVFEAMSTIAGGEPYGPPPP